MTKKKPTKKRATKRRSTRVPKGKIRLRIAVGIDSYGDVYSVALGPRDDPATELDAQTGCSAIAALYVFTAIVDEPKPVEAVEIEMEDGQ